MSTREILTLQFGHYSNYIGAHFWNIQELSFDYTGTVITECNHDILYREGETSTGHVTYTPRLLLADLKGSTKSLPVSGGLANESETTDVVWDKLDKVEEPVSDKNEFLKDLESDVGAHAVTEKKYDLENTVKTWTDFLYPRFHMRTVHIVKEYNHETGLDNFDIYQNGKSQWRTEFGELFSDNIRKYVEECNSIQGFQVNFDCVDGFSGLALGCIEHLVDEYSKPIIAHPVIPSYFPDNDPTSQEERDKSTMKDSIRLVNTVLAIEELSQNATFYVPLSTGERGWRKPGNARQFDNIQYNPRSYYQSSAILAAAMDTLSQKYRQKSNTFTMSDICADMTGYGRRMGAASLGIPPINESQYLIEYLNNLTKPIYTSITPSCKIATDKIFQLITVRGIPESHLKAAPKEAKEQMNIPAYRCNSVKEMFGLYFQANNFLSATDVTVCEKPLHVKTPFPRFFEDNLNKFGFIQDNSQERIESTPMLAGYHNGTFMADVLEKMHREVSRIKFNKLHKFQEEGMESTEYQETLDRLAEFKDNYEDDFEL